MDNGRNLRPRKIVEVKSTAQCKKPSPSSISTSSRLPGAKSATSAKFSERPRASEAHKQTGTRLSLASKNSPQVNSSTSNANSTIKILTEKVSRFEAKLEEIAGFFERLKDENQKLQFAVTDLVNRQVEFSEAEEDRRSLKAENDSFRLVIADLKSEVARLITVVQSNQEEKSDNDLGQVKSEVAALSEELRSLKFDNNPSVSPHEAAQDRVNCNIVIRGAGATPSTSVSELQEVYSGLRQHLDIDDSAEFEPVSIEVIHSIGSKNSSSSKPIRVQFNSIETKRKFLQVRRVKKAIFQSDIGIKSGSSQPVIISEELTRSNQELLYQARSLRIRGNYKFVWSCNGQVLARFRKKSKVVRIVDTAHVNFLRAQVNLDPLPENGRRSSGTSFRSNQSFMQV